MTGFFGSPLPLEHNAYVTLNKECIGDVTPVVAKLDADKKFIKAIARSGKKEGVIWKTTKEHVDEFIASLSVSDRDCLMFYIKNKNKNQFVGYKPWQEKPAGRIRHSPLYD